MAKKWQSENGFHCKAFLIPALDLIEVLEEMNILLHQGEGNYKLGDLKNSGVRTYLAIDRPIDTMPVASTEKLLIVGTYVDKEGIHRDIIKGEELEQYEKNIKVMVENLDGSGIYDFTDPCPTTCDNNSPLFNPNV